MSFEASSPACDWMDPANHEEGPEPSRSENSLLWRLCRPLAKCMYRAARGGGMPWVGREVCPRCKYGSEEHDGRS